MSKKKNDPQEDPAIPAIIEFKKRVHSYCKELKNHSLEQWLCSVIDNEGWQGLSKLDEALVKGNNALEVVSCLSEPQRELLKQEVNRFNRRGVLSALTYAAAATIVVPGDKMICANITRDKTDKRNELLAEEQRIRVKDPIRAIELGQKADQLEKEMGIIEKHSDFAGTYGLALFGTAAVTSATAAAYLGMTETARIERTKDFIDRAGKFFNDAVKEAQKRRNSPGQ